MMVTIIKEIEKENLTPAAVTFRPGTVADSFTVNQIFEQTILDLSQRMGMEVISGGQDEEALATLWERRRPLFEHLAETAVQFWIAEQDDQAIGYARSVQRGELLELTEFFVLPGQQASGVGRELLRRAFSEVDSDQRAIIATTDIRAMARYLKTGVYPRFAGSYFSRPATQVTVESDLTFKPMHNTSTELAILGHIDQDILGHERDVDHRWLREQQQGYFYERAGQPVGYGYIGSSNGPFALLEAADFPAVLAHAESQTAPGDEFGVEVPLINRAAVDYLLAAGFRMEAFLTLFMSNIPFGRFENYIFPSPPFFV